MEVGAGPREVGKWDVLCILWTGQVGLALPLGVAVPQALGLVTGFWMRQEQRGSLCVSLPAWPSLSLCAS